MNPIRHLRTAVSLSVVLLGLAATPVLFAQTFVSGPSVGLSAITVNGVASQTLQIEASNGEHALVEGYGFNANSGASPSSARLVLATDGNIATSGSSERRVAAAGYFPHPKAIELLNEQRATLLTQTDVSALQKSGFYFLINTRSLPSGVHRLTHIEVTLPGQSAVRVPLTEQASINVNPSSLATQLPPLTLTALNGLTTLSATPVPGGRAFVLRNYPAAKDGDYQLPIPAITRYGEQSAASGATVTLRYQRPIVKVPLSAPNVLGFSGAAPQITLTNPLNGFPISTDINGELLPGSAPLSVNGQTLAAGASFAIAYGDAQRAHTLNATMPGAPSGATATAWLNLPDAPSIEFAAQSWNPAAALTPAWSNTDPIVARLQETRLTFNLDRTLRGGCVATPVLFTGQLPSELSRLRPGETACAVRLVNVPAGFSATPDASAFVGKAQSAGTEAIEFQKGIVYKSNSGEMTFYPAATTTETHNLVAINQRPLSIVFTPLSTYRTPRGSTATGLLTGVGTNVTAGQLSVQGAFPGLQVSIASGATVAHSTTSTRLQAALQTSIANAGSNQTVTVTAWYSDTPDVLHTETMEFTAMGAPATLTLNAASLSNALMNQPVEVTGSFGRNNANGLTFDTASMGAWRIVLERYDAVSRSWVTLGESTSIAANAAWAITIPPQDRGKHALRARAVLLANDALSQELTTRAATLDVSDGSQIIATISATPATTPIGENQFVDVRLSAVLPAGRSIDAETTRWQIRALPSADWVDLAQRGSRVTARLSSAGTFAFRAAVENKHTDTPAYSDEATVEAFSVPTVSITAPAVSTLGTPVAISASVVGSRPASLSWVVTKPDRSTETFSGTTISIPSAAGATGAYSVRVEAKWGDDPIAASDNRRVGVATHQLIVVAAKPPLPIINNPIARWELNRPYEVRAQAPALTGALQSLASTLRMAWVLPNGSQQAVTSAPLSVSFTASTETLKLRAWFETTPDEFSEAILRPPLWAYSFPATWAIQARALESLEAPTRVAFTLVPSEAPVLGPGDSIAVNWTVGAGDVIEAANGYTATVKITTPGPRTITAQLTDQRGATRSAAATVTVDPPKDRVVTFSASTTDSLLQVPFTIHARPSLLSWPKGDPIQSVTFTVNGVVMHEGAWQGSISRALNVTDPGATTVQLRVRGESGAEALAAQTYTAIMAAPPVCSIRETARSASRITYAASCTRPGATSSTAVSSYEWRLAPSESAAIVGTSNFINIIPTGQAGARLYLKACATKGGCVWAEAPINW